MQKITPFLWFNGQAEEAMNYYQSIFKNTKVVNISRNGDNVFSVSFEIEGQSFIALNAGPEYSFTPAVSFFVNCDSQDEVDELWGKLTAEGKEGRCGWLEDKYGLSWQIVPSLLGKLLSDQDRKKSQNVMNAMMQMNKIDCEKLEEAYNNA